jgi:hypothetical protein
METSVTAVDGGSQMKVKTKTLYMETTHIEASQTVGEIQRVLGQYGASAIRMDYDDNREVSSVSFTVLVNGDHIPFRLPCRWQAVYEKLKQRRKRRPYKRNDEAQARRIAWRQILRWVEAQLALVDTEMVKLPEVFMSYLITDKGQTLYEKIESQSWKFQQLEHKK